VNEIASLLTLNTSLLLQTGLAPALLMLISGSLTLDGLRSLLVYLGAGPGGQATVCISDIREVRSLFLPNPPMRSSDPNWLGTFCG
jgi:hypothetical protein